ncbi:sensor histidine kinase [Oceanispirochaeta crateris]|uniref:sensor histidine kinase n=1 Tax=Oceanispirochaeta crateris TaxID=2518645 RepID=UPI00143D7C71|nr:ATP-binding protein [Oceanispirochaeta crateris]
MNNYNQEDLNLDLQSESDLLFNSFNSWKHGMWRFLIRIKDNESIRDLLDQNLKLAQEELSIILDSSGMDFLYVRNDKKSFLLNLGRNLSFPELSNFFITKEYPYIEIREVNGSLYFVGNLRIYGRDRFEYDFFLVKKIDAEFSQQLVYQTQSDLLYYSNEQYYNGSIDSKIIEKKLPHINLLTATKQFESLDMDETLKSLVFRKGGQLIKDGDISDFVLITVLSQLPYIKRSLDINGTVLFVSLLSILIAAVLSFIISSSITTPIKRVIANMQRVREDDFPVSIEYNAKSEINQLYEGFNSMAYNLYNGKIAMEDYVKEIEFLKDYNETIIHSIRAGIAIIDSNLKVVKVNDFFQNFMALSNGDIQEVNFIDEQIILNVNLVLSKRKDSFTCVKRVGSSLILDVKIYPLVINKFDIDAEHQCILIIEDITSKHQFEEKIMQAEKLSSLSMLSAGVAHEINNPLSTIMINVQNELAKETDSSKFESLKWIEQETRRIAIIVNELLSFASSRSVENEYCDVNTVIDQTISLIQYSIAKEKDIRFHSKVNKIGLGSKISKDELKQILINLFSNSIRSIGKKGHITIHTGYKSENENIYIEIIDTGCGMEEQLLNKIFNPFFTTDHEGSGTGLGLSVVYGIVNKYNGTIEVSSKPGQGSTFLVILPADFKE